MKSSLKVFLIPLLCFVILPIVIMAGIVKWNEIMDGYNKYQSHRETIEQIDRVKKEIRENRPKASDKDITDEAILIVSGSQEFDVPLKFQLACIKMETEFNPNCIGPCGEKSLLQIYYPTFISYYPPRKWNDPLYTYMAGMAHYEECVKIALKHEKGYKNQLLLSLCLHNAGNRFSNPAVAYGVAWKHLKRANQLKIWI